MHYHSKALYIEVDVMRLLLSSAVIAVGGVAEVRQQEVVLVLILEEHHVGSNVPMRDPLGVHEFHSHDEFSEYLGVLELVDSETIIDVFGQIVALDVLHHLDE